MLADTIFDLFYRSVGDDARRYARAILGPSQASALDDVLQEAWVRAWRSWDAADPARRHAWFLRIVRNVCLDRHRRARPGAEIALDEAVLPPAGNDPDPFAGADSAMALLDGLPAGQREALWLREVAQLTYAEIAAVQSVPIGTVMSRLHAARKKAARVIGSRW